MLISINSDHPEPRKIRRAVEALEAGEAIAYPTDTAYAFGCDVMNKKAIDKLYAIKGMTRDHHLAFVCPDLSNIARYAVVENQAYRILKHYLPGPYCFILEATREVPKMVQSKRKTVGIRIPNHEVIRAITRELGRPVLTTTAKRQGQDLHIDPHEIDAEFKGLAMVLDGEGGGNTEATVIDISKMPPEVIREGAGPIEDFI